ncbi:VCBS repeat-containing protein [Streptomyces sp. NPDC047974]|uniref:VCBS repeat-containing protein n=1 Tax=Streptomyces sp. NPDC047974 TaxID=3154343 RepID=UPI0034118186
MNRVLAAIAGIAVTAALLVGAASPAAQAEIPLPAVEKLRVITWNMCGDAGGERMNASKPGYCPRRNYPQLKIDALKKLVMNHQANVVMLQEACGYAPDDPHESQLPLSHMGRLQQALDELNPGEWVIRHTVVPRDDGDETCYNQSLTYGSIGNLLAIRKGVASSFSEHALTPYNEREFTLLCGRMTGWRDNICTTHLVPGQSVIAQQQAREIRQLLATDLATGYIVGGDINRPAGRPELAPFDGLMHVVSSTQMTRRGWSPNPAPDGSWIEHSLDNIFLTRRPKPTTFIETPLRDNSTYTGPEADPPATPDTPDLTGTGVSDHAPVVSYIDPPAIPGDMTGDGRPDLVAVDTEGKLRLYQGTGTGALLAPVPLGARGWSGAPVTHRGDWTGDGKEDIVAVIGSELRIYPNSGTEPLGAHKTVPGVTVPAGSRLIGVGDATGDGQPDLVAISGTQLYLYEGNQAPGITAVRLIGNSGWGDMDLAAPGDATHDGNPDLLVRHHTSGDLWLYPGSGDGTFSYTTRTRYGSGYTTTARPLITGAADADGNKRADMWATTPTETGTLLFYTGATDTTGNPIDGPRTEVGTSGWQTTITSIS